MTENQCNVYTLLSDAGTLHQCVPRSLQTAPGLSVSRSVYSVLAAKISRELYGAARTSHLSHSFVRVHMQLSLLTQASLWVLLYPHLVKGSHDGSNLCTWKLNVCAPGYFFFFFFVAEGPWGNHYPCVIFRAAKPTDADNQCATAWVQGRLLLGLKWLFCTAFDPV